MKTRQLAQWGFEFGAFFLMLAAIFLVIYYFVRMASATGKKPVLWLVLSACCYVAAFGGLIFMMISYFQNFVPTMGDFSNVSWSGGSMTAANENGEFKISNLVECISNPGGRPQHSVSFRLTNLSEHTVTIQRFLVISRIDDKEVGPYESRNRTPLQMAAGADEDVELHAEISDRIRDHKSESSKNDYGLTAYLQVVSSVGSLPGVPIHFPDNQCP
jgi:hypothetical protein